MIWSSQLGRDLQVSSWCRVVRPHVLLGEQTVQAGAVELIAGMLMSKTGRTALFQVVYFIGPFCCVSAVFICSLNQWELVSPDLSLSGTWIILSPAFFSFASPAALVWMPGSHHHWPSNHP